MLHSCACLQEAEHPACMHNHRCCMCASQTLSTGHLIGVSMQACVGAYKSVSCLKLWAATLRGSRCDH